MDSDDHISVDEISDLHSLSKEALVGRIVELTKEKKELWKKLHTSSVAEEQPDRTNACNLDCEPPMENNSSEDLDDGIHAKASEGSGRTKKQRSFDFTRYHKRHIALKMAYLGWDFHGFASQESTENTIESHFFAALSKACLIENRADCNYSRCGRTDKGVSAFSQVVSLDVRSNLTEGLGLITSGDHEKVQKRVEKAELLEIPYAQVLNKLLPSEIRIIAWAPVGQEFDARFSCLNRTYKYFFPVANVDVDLMNHAAQKFVGKHDFRNFCKMDVANGVVAFERELISCTVQKNSLQSCNGYEICELIICGSAFLWHQVRCMAAVLLMIGQKLEKSDVIDWMLNIKQCPRRPQYNMASEVPLVLYDSCYEKLLWKHEPGVLEVLLKDFQAQWTTHTIKARMLTSLIDKLDDAAVITHISEEGDKAVTWRDIRQPQFHQLSSLVPFQVTTKVHKPLMKRATHESFESKLESVNAKRRKVGKEEF